MRPARTRPCRALALASAFLFSVGAASPAAAQIAPPPPPRDSEIGRAHLVVFGANVAIGGLTAGIRQWRRDGSFLDGLWRGGLGGVGTFYGKMMAVSDFPGAGLAGRAIAGAGASVSRNAADGVPTFHRLVLPVGPVRLHWQPSAGTMHASFDAAGFAALTGSYVSGIGASLDLKRSLSSGAPVLLARDWESDWGWQARHVAGTILLRGDESHDLDHDRFMAVALAHERVHVLQYDQAYILWSEPLERRALDALGASPLLVRSLDLSLHSVVLLGLNAVIPYHARPWEIEADVLSGTSQYRRLADDRILFRR